MPTITLVVVTRGPAFQLRQKDIPPNLADSVKIMSACGRVQEGLGAEQIVTLIIDISRDLAVGVFSSWLYDKLKERKDGSAKLNESPVQDRETIEKILRTILEVKRESDSPP